MAPNSTLSAILILVLGAAPAFPQAPPAPSPGIQDSPALKEALDHLEGLKPGLGLDSFHGFLPGRVRTDGILTTHVHFAQMYRGIPVFQGAAVTHQDARGGHLEITDALVRGIAVDVEPGLPPSEALAIAEADLRPRGGYARPPTIERVIFPLRALRAKAGVGRPSNAMDFEPVVLGHALAYHIHASLRNPGEIRDVDYMIDAHSGRILKSWNDLHTLEALGRGNSQFSGTVALSTRKAGGEFSLTDTGRGGTTVLNLDNGVSGPGTPFTSASDVWGDGNNYYDDGSSGPTSGATGQTAAVDAQYGFQITWDFYRNVLGRDGIDDLGTGTSLLVHAEENLDNAYWDDGCFCMTFGDGSAPAKGGLRNLTAPDVISHELSHGVCANNGQGGLTYEGEPGCLNEANSDILGTFAVFYGRNGGTGSTVPDTIPKARLHGYIPWTMGSQLSKPPGRFLYKPSLDGRSVDAWTPYLGEMDVHRGSGPARRMIYFLSQGATVTGDTASSFLPGGMTGIGNDHAARIWYRALTTYFTPGETYVQCRAACARAASDLYGPGSRDVDAVRNAFAAIHVGEPAGVLP